MEVAVLCVSGSEIQPEVGHELPVCPWATHLSPWALRSLPVKEIIALDDLCRYGSLKML